MVKNHPANAGDARDMDSILESGRSLREGMATHSSILAWKVLADFTKGFMELIQLLGYSIMHFLEEVVFCSDI